MTDELKRGSDIHWYQIGSVLGRGGFGITYQATDTNLQSQVAIKEYLPVGLALRDKNGTSLRASADNEDSYKAGLSRFIEEARTLAKFKHPNIVRVLAVFEDNNTAYMVMEYEEGNSLGEMLKTPRYQTEERLVEVFDAILSGLEEVHARNIIHRDIKPANIYIRRDGSPVLLDFGSAREQVVGTHKQMTQYLTPGYAPYEQLDHKAGPQGPWTDIYSIGASLYFAINRKLPSDSFERFTNIVRKKPDSFVPLEQLPDTDRYSDAFVRAINQALEFEAENRPQDIASFRELLSTCRVSIDLDNVEQVEYENSDATVFAPDTYSNNNIHEDSESAEYRETASESAAESSPLAQSFSTFHREDRGRKKSNIIWGNRGLIAGFILGGLCSIIILENVSL